MKKIVSIILTLIMCISLVSCNVTTPPQSTATATPPQTGAATETENKTPDMVTTFEYPEAIEYGIYTSGTDSVFKQDALIDGTVKRISKINITGENFSDILSKNEVPEDQINNEFWELKTNEFFGNEVDYEVKSTFLCGSDFAKCLNPYVKCNTIVRKFICSPIGSSEMFSVNVDLSTGKILNYSRLYDIPKEGNFTMEEAKKKAIEIAESEFGKGVLDEYKVSLEETRNDRYVLWYSRTIEDFNTNQSDCLKFAFALNGEVLLYSAECFGRLEGVLDKLTEENLKNAEETLRKTFVEGTKVGEKKYIVIDNITGVCYIELRVGLESYYINIY